MARKTNKVAPKVNDDTAAAQAALAELKGLTLKNAPDFAAKIADTPTEGGIQRSMSMLAYRYGSAERIAKIGFVKGGFDSIFMHYANRFYRDDREMPTEGSLTGYKSRYGAYFQAGHLPYDATAMVTAVAGVRDVNLVWRASKLRELIEAHPTKAPSRDELAAALVREEGTGGGTGNQTPETKVKRFISAGVTLGMDETVIQYLAANPTEAALLRNIFLGCASMRELEVPALKGKRKTGAQTEVAMLKARAEALAAKAGKGKAKAAPAGVTTH